MRLRDSYVKDAGSFVQRLQKLQKSCMQNWITFLIVMPNFRGVGVLCSFTINSISKFKKLQKMN